MKPMHHHYRQGFTLLETVIAIGVLAVLLSGFLVVFAPAAAGIRQSINVQQADRLASALEKEMSTLRPGDPGLPPQSTTGFDKAFEWVLKSNTGNDKLQGAVPIFVYQYRADVTQELRNDGTRQPFTASLTGKFAGKDYLVVPMARRRSDPLFQSDLSAIEGAVYLVKAKHLVRNNDKMELGKGGEIKDPRNQQNPGAKTQAADFSEAVLPFAAEFHLMPTKDFNYFSSGTAFEKKFESKTPVFTRNLAATR